MNNTLWEKEEFEDLVARGLIAMYESKIKFHKDGIKPMQFTSAHLERIRKKGCYFTPEDRVVFIDCHPSGTTKAIQNFDIVNDGLPTRAIHCHSIDMEYYKNAHDDIRKDAYLEINYLEKLLKFPHPIKPSGPGYKYRCISLWPRNNILEGHCHYVSIDLKGNIYDTWWTRPNYDPVTGRCPHEIVNAKNCQSQEESKRCESLTTVTATTTLQLWQDRRYLWNVTANEGIAKATFGVYPEEIKSLFYSREMPMTETGRKRPILHWVAAHHRRLRNGIDIDIEKYLRGVNEFVYNGTKFIITRPIKQNSMNNIK